MLEAYRDGRAVLLAGLLTLTGANCVIAQPADRGPRELFESLSALRVATGQVYYVRDLNLRRDVVRIAFEEGKLAFLAPLEGRVTGMVFTGRGRALAVPRDPMEKGSLARFLGAPLLDEPFSSAYLRFDDGTAEDILRQLREAALEPTDEPAFVDEWNPVVANLNPWHSLRILADWFSDEPRPYFYAGLTNDKTGPFDVLVDNRLTERVVLGQPRWLAGQRYYDVWASLASTEQPERPGLPFTALDYAIDTTILPDRTLQSTTTVTLKASRGGERVIPLELSRYLTVQSAEDAAGHSLVFFQNEAINSHQIEEHGNDWLLVVLPAPAHVGQQFQLRIAYRGSVISDAGNGVYFVGHRGSWYPHPGGLGEPARFELTFRWPRKLQLVATGEKVEEREEGNVRIGRWRSEVPIPVAGFNLGEYTRASVKVGSTEIDLYANSQLERLLSERFRPHVILAPVPLVSTRPGAGNPATAPILLPEVPPSPAAALNELGRDIADAVRFFERFGGPLPYRHLGVTQIPGTFGQGWPGLLYLSTFVFLAPSAQQRAGLSQRSQEEFTELLPYHEVAHQWWGNAVVWGSYHDEWIPEALANYLAILYADTKKNPERALAAWLDRYRRELTSRPPDQPEMAEEIGALILGYRLRSSRSPKGYEQVIYAKGTWVMHMLRMMLRDTSGAKTETAGSESDARFISLLHSLVETHRDRPLTTGDFQRAVEQVMTPAMALEGERSMDWFFDQWVRSTGIPRYAVEFSVKAQGQGFLVRGKLKQRNVPETFLAAVPLYTVYGSGKQALLGTVVTSGAETPFQFTTRVPPRRILIDPQNTLLCTTE